MTPEAWQAISAIVGTVGAVTSAVAVALITSQRGQVKRSADAAEAARDEATAAKDNTAPISNGFARKTTETLASLDRRSRAHEARLTWLTDALGQHLTMHGAADVLRRNGRTPMPSQWWPQTDDANDAALFGFGDAPSPPGADYVGDDHWGISPG
jgi:hypothetical protein